MIKTVSVCDHCGAEALIQASRSLNLPPFGWFGVLAYSAGFPASSSPDDVRHYCSPSCVTAALSKETSPRMEREATA